MICAAMQLEKYQSIYFAAASLAVAALNMEISILTNIIVHPTKARYIKYLGIFMMNGSCNACESLNVQAVYIPNGKTMPQ